jgi:flagellar biogenesis protein FliO
MRLAHSTIGALPFRSALTAGSFVLAVLAGSVQRCFADTNALSSIAYPALPDAGPSVLRVVGALGMVLALFFVGAWLLRNWHRVVVQRGQSPKLNVREVRSLGNRQALYVVSYEKQVLLLASSSAGINLLTRLDEVGPAADLPVSVPAAEKPSFAQTLHQLIGKP